VYDLSNSAIFNYLNNYLGLPRVQGHPIIQRWISQKRYKLDTWLLQTRPLLRSDMWPIELCRRQWPWWTIVLAVFVWNQCSLLVRFLIGNQTKDDIADDLERPLKVISGYYKRFHCLYLKKQHDVQSELQRSDVICELLFPLLYSTKRTVIRYWARPVGDSWTSTQNVHFCFLA